MRSRPFRDPAELIEEKLDASCWLCKFERSVFVAGSNIKYCEKGRKYGKRCVQYIHINEQEKKCP